VDVLKLELGESLHISDITLPAGVESVDLSHGEDHDLTIASIIKPRGPAEEEEEGSEDEEGETE
jgi:large subunit ribosomal protein L25